MLSRRQRWALLTLSALVLALGAALAVLQGGTGNELRTSGAATTTSSSVTSRPTSTTRPAPASTETSAPPTTVTSTTLTSTTVTSTTAASPVAPTTTAAPAPTTTAAPTPPTTQAPTPPPAPTTTTAPSPGPAPAVVAGSLTTEECQSPAGGEVLVTDFPGAAPYPVSIWPGAGSKILFGDGHGISTGWKLHWDTGACKAWTARF